MPYFSISNIKKPVRRGTEESTFSYFFRFFELQTYTDMKRANLFIVLIMAIIGLEAVAGNQTPKQGKAENLELGNDFPIAYVKKGVLYFFNPENEKTVAFSEETDTVFNCVYSDMDNMFYYTVVRNGKFSLKQVDLSVTPLQPTLLINIDQSTEESFKVYDTAGLYYIKNNLYLGTDFFDEDLIIDGYFNYSIDDKTLDAMSWIQFENECVPQLLQEQEQENDYTSLFNKIEKMVIAIPKYKEMFESYDSNPKYLTQLESTSADGSKILIGVSVEDRSLGPYCIANVDSTMIKIVEGSNLASSDVPLWSNNTLVYSRETEVDVSGHPKWITELCCIRDSDNAVIVIDTDVDYYAVRKQQTDR